LYNDNNYIIFLTLCKEKGVKHTFQFVLLRLNLFNPRESVQLQYRQYQFSSCIDKRLFIEYSLQ